MLRTLTLKIAISALSLGVTIASCGPFDGSQAPGNQCAAIPEAEGEAIARRAVVDFIEDIKGGVYGGTINDGDREISAERIRAIRPEDIIYKGRETRDDAGEIENGAIYRYRVAKLEELNLSVQVFRNCNSEVRWSIDK